MFCGNRVDHLPRVGRDVFPVDVEAPEKQVVRKPPEVSLQELLIAAKIPARPLAQLLSELSQLGQTHSSSGCDIVICPPAPLLFRASELCADTAIAIGAQDCHTAAKGAYTGDISAAMVADTGAKYVIVGHSERRADHGESDSVVRAQAEAALRVGATPIICVGESLAQRQAGETLAVIEAQLNGSLPTGDAEIVVAYEPIWAIGTGEVASVEQINEVHNAIRAYLSKASSAGASTPILYGGSMKPGNAAEILAIENVNGGLIGGASLKAEDFMAIYAAAVA